MAVNKKGLGKGLDSLIPNNRNVKPANPDISTEQVKQPELKSGEQMMKINMVEPNRDQPRKNFEEDALLELADSIKQFGVLQPLLVRKNKDYYEIIAGERRWRAAKLAGIKEVPVIIKDYSEQEIVEIALIENIQRENLNPIEEAIGYNLLMDEFNLTQELISQRVGKSRSAIANSLRLLSLEDEIQKMLILGTLTSGHARAILSLDDKELRIALSKHIIEDNLNVRQAEALAKQLQKKKPQKKKSEKTAYDIEIEKIQNTLSSAMGTKVRINHTAKKGKIEIEYYGNEDLERVLGFFNIKGE